MKSRLRIPIPSGSRRRRAASIALMAWVTACAASSPAAPGSDPERSPSRRSVVCGRLLGESANLLLAMLDPVTGLPYDQFFCDPAAPAGILEPSAVVPQLAYASLGRFAEDPSRVDETVDASFVDRGPDGRPPTLLYALRIELHLDSETNRFGGLTWGASVDVRRYHRLRIRYSTPQDRVWELKLNSAGVSPEPARLLPASPAGQWVDATFDIADDFAPTNKAELNYLVFGANSASGTLEPVLWVDRIVFEADPAETARCGQPCSGPLPPYPDLACFEPLTGAVNIANALSALTLLAATGHVDDATAAAAVGRILATLAALPGTGGGGGGWFQDWHSPASGMPDPRNRIASITDQPQLYAALMVVETTWPTLGRGDLAVRARNVRERMDFSVLFGPASGCPGSTGCPGPMHGAIDRCQGVVCPWRVELFGNDSLLGSFLAEASGGVPACVWSEGLPIRGCELDGAAGRRWYTTGRFCLNAEIPASDTGGPFLQLAGLVYLRGKNIPMGPLSLTRSARHMLVEQDRFGRRRRLELAGWANMSSPDHCGYDTCLDFTADQVTPYIWAMGLGIAAPSRRRLVAFADAGADLPLDTGSFGHAFGLRDSLDQETGELGLYLYLDSGWSVLGMLNYCHGGIVRRQFGRHAVAEAGYRALKSRPPACPRRR